MKLIVSPAVLIPRPETEELVETVINFLKNKTGVPVLDIGTGSGCIAIAIKKNAVSCNITSIDISNTALFIAKQNAVNLHTRIKFLEIDFLQNEAWDQLENYDVIVSNPPYIPETEMEKLDKNVTEYEPHTALFVDNNRPLIFYEKIHEFGKKQLNKQGMIFLETHEDLAGNVCSLFNDDVYSAVIKKDISAKERMVIATKKS